MDSLQGYTREELETILCYPRPSRECYARRLTETLLLGIRNFVRAGGTLLGGIPILGKGTTSIVLQAVYIGGIPVATKIRRLDSNRPSVLAEARILRNINIYGIGPQLLAASRNILIWRLVRGKPFNIWLYETHDADEVKKVLREIAYQLHVLDRAGIAHNELSRPGDHILIESGTPVIMDFESATLNSRRSNVTQFFSILVRESGIGRRLREILGIDKKRVLESLKSYKKNRDIEKVLQALSI